MAATLEYWRADTMWAAKGRPDGDLGKETVTVEPGATRAFVTDWRYEKKRNDGTNYYGSHARRIRNASPTEAIAVRVHGGPLLGAVVFMVSGDTTYQITLAPGEQRDLQHDIVEVRSTVHAASPAPSVPAPPVGAPRPPARPGGIRPPSGRPRS